MIELTESHFHDLCRGATVRSQLLSLEESRKSAVRRFWTGLLGGLASAGFVGWLLISEGWVIPGVILGVILLVAGIVYGVRPLMKVSRELKQPVLEALAQQGAMTYLADDFSPPVYPDAEKLLFGSHLSGRTFTDLFHGTAEDGKRFAIYEATLTRRSGKNTVTVFSGQVYAFQRRSSGSGEVGILPDKGIFNFLNFTGLNRVHFESDPEFEGRFEVYATQPATALGLVDTHLRRSLLGLRAKGKVMAYVGPEDVLIATWGKNRFEAGSMFRSITPEARVRKMFDELCESLAVMRELQRELA